MKHKFQHIGLAKICGWFGVTRQAYYQNNWEGISTSIEEELIVKQVQSIRLNHRKIGGRKLYEMLQPFMQEHSIKIGRDALFSVLAANHLLIKRRKRKIQTTNSLHWLRKYPNLVRDFIPTAINQLWVSDITYWKLGEEPSYISFITDAFSRKIVGYNVAMTLEAVESISSLQMAFSALGAEKPLQLVHHSDRGVQYCSSKYVDLLLQYDVKISMTENGDPLENAIAERLNGIMKQEYLETYSINNLADAKALLSKVVNLYNNERPHMSIGNLTPNQIHHSNNNIKTEKLWKNYYRKNPTIVNQLQD
jgi:transposase InsO family protein